MSDKHAKLVEMLRNSCDETISPSVAAQVLGGNAYTYNLMAKEGKLTLPYIWRGRNLRILKQPLLKLLGE